MPSVGGGGSWLVLATLDANDNSSSSAKTSPNQRSTIYFRKRRSHRRQDSLKETRYVSAYRKERRKYRGCVEGTLFGTGL